MTVREIVGLGRLPHDPPLSGPREVDADAVEAAIERVGVGHLADRDARRLSMGERQLVFVAIALAQAAPILVLDEPTAHLDIRHQVEVMQLLVDLNERDGATIVAVLHDLALAANFFPRVTLMSAGRIVADGPPDEHARRRPHPGRLRGRPGARPAARRGGLRCRPRLRAAPRAGARSLTRRRDGPGRVRAADPAARSDVR